jgi:hypothetical protein
MSDDPFTLRVFPNVPRTPAARMAILEALWRPPIFDEDGYLVGYAEPGEGLITTEQFLELMDMPQSGDPEKP